MKNCSLQRRTFTRRHLSLGLIIALVCAAGPALGKNRTFNAEGSDTAAGIGPRYIALGGAGVALTDDVYAMFNNPAGLAEIEGFEFSAARQLNAKELPVSFLGAAYRLPFVDRLGINAVVGASFIPRLHAKSTGAYTDDDFESIFLRYLLPGITGTFDGDIQSKTKDYRIGLGIGPTDSNA